MKADTYRLNTILAGLTGLASLAIILVRTFAPGYLIPLVNIPNMAAVCSAALVVDCYLGWKKPAPARCFLVDCALGVLTFWLLPWAAGLCGWGEALRVGVIGGILFAVMSFAFTGIRQRLSSGKYNILAPLASGAVLYLAFQAFAAILL